MASSIAINIQANGVQQVQSAFSSLAAGAANLRSRFQGLASVSFNNLEGKLSRLDSQLEELSTKRFDNIRSSLDSLNNVGDTIVGIGVKGGLALAGIAGGALKASANVESISVGLRSMLGSADAAAAKMKEIRDFANVSPFNFTQSARAAQKLLASGFSSSELMPTLNSVGNAVSAAGGGTEEFTGVLTALGQIKTAGKLTKEDLNQITERNIPATRILQEQLGLTAAQVADIGNQGISSEKAIAALLKGMGEIGGGKAMEAQSKTLGGEFSTLQDGVEGLAGAIGDTLAPEAKAFIEQLTALVSSLTDWVKANPEAVRGAFNLGKNIALATLAVGGLTKAFALGGKSFLWITDAVSKFRTLTGIIKGTSDAKSLLEKVTKSDTAAELAKGKAAGVEGSAIAKVGEEAAETGSKLGVLSRIKGFAGMPLGGLRMLNGAPVTAGGAAVSAALGVAAGYGAKDDYSSLGYSDTQANTAGIVTGVGAGLVALFVPGGAVAVALATGVRYAFNELYNRPLEKAAEQGSGFSDEQTADLSKKSASEKADEYFKLAEQKRNEGDDTSATSYLIEANNQRKIAKRQALEQQKQAQQDALNSLGPSGLNPEYDSYLKSRGISTDTGAVTSKGYSSSAKVKGSRMADGRIKLEGVIDPSSYEKDARAWANMH